MSDEAATPTVTASKDETPKVPEVLPVLPLRDIVIFPFMIVPLYVSRERSIKAVDAALADNRMILLTAQKRRDDEDPGPDDMFTVGTVALIMRCLLYTSPSPRDLSTSRMPSSA